MRRRIVGRSRREDARAHQLTLFRRGGKRPGAGRKRRGPRPLVSHKARPKLSAHSPVLVTTRVHGGLPSLRHAAELKRLHAAFGAATEQFGFRLIHFSIQSNHLHFLVEAQDATALARGMKGLIVRVARALNRLWARTGSVFADRYHARILASPRAVRHALAYVLNNARKHGIAHFGADPFSSGAWFDGWLERRPARVDSPDDRDPPPRSSPRTWLLRVGWRKHGLVAWNETPGRR